MPVRDGVGVLRVEDIHLGMGNADDHRFTDRATRQRLLEDAELVTRPDVCARVSTRRENGLLELETVRVVFIRINCKIPQEKAGVDRPGALRVVPDRDDDGVSGELLHLDPLAVLPLLEVFGGVDKGVPRVGAELYGLSRSDLVHAAILSSTR